MASNARSNETKLRIHTANIPASKPASKPASAMPRRIHQQGRSLQERLLRNSCIACAALLSVLALGSMNLPWAQKASDGIQQALTMEIDLDRSLGQLSFVQRLMPESALVFFNLNGASELQSPVQGELSHAYSAAQPWLMFSCDSKSAACAPADGSIAAVSQLDDGSWGVLIDHGSGMESILAGLAELSVQTGDSVLRGAPIGRSSRSLFFELRQDSASIDPTEMLGL